MNVLNRIQQLQTERGWSEYKMADKCGLSTSTLANIFRRNTMPSIPTLEAICKGFGITMAQFFAEGDMVELSPELKDLFDHWVSLAPEQKEAVLQLVKVMQKK